jgi:hypothetical protein
MTTTQFPWLEPLATVRAGVLEVASYQAGPADGGHSSLLPNVRQVLGEGDPHERSFHPTAHPGGPRPGLRRTEPPSRVHRHLHQPLHRRRWTAPARVIGGEGPPLLLVHGWPQTWYAWRMVMPTLEKPWNWQ